MLVAPLLVVAMRVLSYRYTYRVNVPLGETSLVLIVTLNVMLDEIGYQSPA